MIEKSLGEKIRELREAADISLREMAIKKLNVSPAFWSDVELGRRYPSEKMLEEVSKVLEYSLDELREYDVREPVAEIKKRSETNPAVAYAFRTVLDKVKEGMSPEEIIRRVNKGK